MKNIIIKEVVNLNLWSVLKKTVFLVPFEVYIVTRVIFSVSLYFIYIFYTVKRINSISNLAAKHETDFYLRDC